MQTPMDAATQRKAVRGLRAAAVLGDEELVGSAEQHFRANEATLTAVSSVPEALSVLRECYVDVWLVDFGLPGDGALSLIREIRNHSRAGILVTGPFDAARAVRFQRFDAVILLAPFAEHQLLAAVATALRLALPHRSLNSTAAKQLNTSSTYQELAVATDFKACRMAELLRLSPRQLHRHFREHFVVGPQCWLSEYRLALSLKRLRLDGSIKLTAFSLAFLHASNFAREFKKAFGTSPVWVARGGTLPAPTMERAELRLRQAAYRFDRSPNHDCTPCRTRTPSHAAGVEAGRGKATCVLL